MVDLAGLTELRRAVLDLVAAAPAPLTAYQLLDRLRAKRGNAMPPTVYRALDWLLSRHLIHKIETTNAFVACADPETPHPAQFLICDRCGGVAELEDAGVSSALRRAAETRGFRAARSVVEVAGTCAACATN